MNKLLSLLRKTRDARKEAALGRLSAAQGRLAQAMTLLRTANQGFQEAQVWREELLRRNGAGLGKDWRHTMLPSCQALLYLRASEITNAAKQVEEQRHAVTECRAALTLCEKALLRTDELQDILKDETRDAERLAEQSQDDDLAIAHGSQSAAITAPQARQDQPWK
jgi:flagellar biosynthesis chaperone FliJ